MSADFLYGIEVIINGLMAGVLYALVALGFVLIYKASGIFNYAQGVMALFAALHLLGSALSERIAGRWREVATWGASIEYAVWFIVYAMIVPYIGYLPATLLFAVLLVLRSGYRGKTALISAVAAAIVIVIVFKAFLQVKIPSGEIYEILPDGIRQIMLTYF